MSQRSPTTAVYFPSREPTCKYLLSSFLVSHLILSSSDPDGALPTVANASCAPADSADDPTPTTREPLQLSTQFKKTTRK